MKSPSSQRSWILVGKAPYILWILETLKPRGTFVPAHERSSPVSSISGHLMKRLKTSFPIAPERIKGFQLEGAKSNSYWKGKGFPTTSLSTLSRPTSRTSSNSLIFSTLGLTDPRANMTWRLWCRSKRELKMASFFWRESRPS